MRKREGLQAEIDRRIEKLKFDLEESEEPIKKRRFRGD